MGKTEFLTMDNHPKPNLLFNAAQPKGTYFWYDISDNKQLLITQVEDEEKGNCLKVVVNSSTFKWCIFGNSIYKYFNSIKKFKIGKKYTISYDYKSSRPVTIFTSVADSNSTNYIFQPNGQADYSYCTSEWKRSAITYECIADGVNSLPYLMFIIRSPWVVGTEIYLSNVKIEEGEYDTGCREDFPDSLDKFPIVCNGTGASSRLKSIFLQDGTLINTGYHSASTNTNAQLGFTYLNPFVDNKYSFVGTAHYSYHKNTGLTTATPKAESMIVSIWDPVTNEEIKSKEQAINYLVIGRWY